MKFIIEQPVFHRALQKVNRAVTTSSTLPILSGILLEGKASNDEENNLQLTATDLELGISHRVSASIQKPGRVVMPASELSNIIRELSSEPVKVEVNQENFTASIETTNSNFSLKCFDPEEFPSLPKVKEMLRLWLPASKLKEIIDSVKFACGKKESRPGLTGSLLTVSPEKIIMVSTNTYRMAYKESENSSEISEEYRAILPAKTLQELSNLLPEVIELEKSKAGSANDSGLEEAGEKQNARLDLEEYEEEEEESEAAIEEETAEEKQEGLVEILLNSSHCLFNLNDTLLTSRLIEGKFPNYRQVMPAEFKSLVTANRRQLQQAVKRAALIAEVLKLNFNSESGTLVMESTETEKGHAREEIPITMEGEDQSINIDASYLQDVLRVISDEEIRLQLIGPLKPMAIQKIDYDDYLYLIMPIRSGTR